MQNSVYRQERERVMKRAIRLSSSSYLGPLALLLPTLPVQAHGDNTLIGTRNADTISAQAQPDANVLHTTGNSKGHEVLNVIAVSKSKLLPLLPEGYDIRPADTLDPPLGGGDQGIVAIANFRGIHPTVDGRPTGKRYQVAIDVGILVHEPPKAEQAGVNIPGAFHLYTLAIYTDDARYAASLGSADMPVEFVNKISYQREMNDATGVGDLFVSVPSRDSPFKTVSSSEQGYALVTDSNGSPLPFNAVLWHDGSKGTAALHFLDEPFRQGQAIGQIYTQPQSKWEALFSGGGLGSCAPPDAPTSCVIAPSVNLKYDKGTLGKLVVIP
jgi:hypothetical protein